MEYLTADEEYELQYMDELETANEMESFSNVIKVDQVKGKLVFGGQTETSASNTQGNNVVDSIDKSTQISISSKRSFEDDDDEDNSVIKRRRFYSGSSSKSRVYTHTNLVSDQKFPEPLYSGYSVPLPLTRFDGTIIYLNLYESDESETLSKCKGLSHLLPISVADLKMEILRKNSLEAVARNNIANSSSVLPTCGNTVPRKSSAKCDLWVEKYRPKRFIDLLSDAGVNRVLLRWLKLWDKVVFGKEVIAKRKKPVLQNKAFTKFRKPRIQLNEDLDEHGRPMQKVALLCGPPGLGKTTLAMVIAQHAGYNVVELNASDDRSPDIFRRNLEAATQMKAVLDPDRRPNCLVIDEIDGTPTPSVDLLVTFVKSLGSSKGKRKKGDIPLLLRPIICICNDQYVPALKSLRQVALILNFPPTSKNRLISRLYEVAQIESLKTDLISLDMLCEKANNDIRSCLSTIQFLCTLKKEMRSSDVSKVEIGLKDIHKSLFSVWHDIFHVPKEDMGRIRIDEKTNNAYVDTNEASLKKRFSQTLRTVQGYGEYEKLFIGLFENYLNIKFRLTSIDLLSQGPEWMCFSDIIQRQIWQNQFFLLMPYLPFVGVAFNLLYAASTYPRLSYPSAFYECKSKRTQLSNVLSSVVKEVITTAKNFFDLNNLVLDVLPMLMEILKPNIRPLNIQLYKAYEKDELKRIVDLMISLHLNYRQDRSPDGRYDFILEPTIENLVYFSGIDTHKPLPYIVKQIISHEIIFEKLREKYAKEVLMESKVMEAKVINEVIKPTSLSKAQNAFCAFFGKKVEKPTVKAVKDTPVTCQLPTKITDDVWYYFNEGFNNAVKKTVRVKDFL